MVAAALAQVGEFSFILAGIGRDQKLIGEDLYSLVISSSLISIFFSPFLVALGDRAVELTKRQGVLERMFKGRAHASEEVPLSGLAGHTIVGGYGRVGRELVETLENEGIQTVVVEHNPAVARELARRGIPYVYGDIADQSVLKEAGLGTARLLALTLPDPVAIRGVVQAALALNPKIELVVRVHYVSEIAKLRSSEPVHFVHPEFEAGLHFARHALTVYGLDLDRAGEHIETRRVQHYGGADAD